jgi:hypothetical protein
VLSVTTLAFINNSEPDCSKEFEKIYRYYTNSDITKYHVQFAIQNIEDTITGERVINNLWLDGAKMKLENNYIKVVQDDKTQIIILKAQKTIVVRNIEDTAKKQQAVPYNYDIRKQLDTLKKIASQITCSKEQKKGRLDVYFPPKNGKIPNVFKEVDYTYNYSTGEVYTIVYNYYTPNNKPKRDIYEYLLLEKKCNDEELKISPLQIVLNNGKLKKEYEKYTYRDIRKTRKNKVK